MILQRPLTFFDLETTGVDVGKDRIVSVGIVKLHPNGKKETFEYFVNPQCAIPAEATAVHGITNEQVADSPPFKEVANEIYAIFVGSDIGGYNSNRFDVPFIFTEFARAGIIWEYTAHKFVDVMNIYARVNERTLAAAYQQYIGGDFDAHDAVADVEATIEVFEAMVREHEDIPMAMEALDLYCNYDKVRADLSGKFYWDDETLRFNFGPKKDEPVKDHPGLIDWILSKDFPPDVRYYCKVIKERIQNNSL